MSRNADLETLAAELAAINAGTAGAGGGTVVVARVLRNMTEDRWQKIRRTVPARHWAALPVSSPVFGHLADVEDAPAAHEGIVNLLAAELLSDQLGRELARLSRTGGSLSLIAVAPLPTGNCGADVRQRLTGLLAEMLDENLESCDSLGATATGYPVALLPGAGQLATRRIAEHLRRDFGTRAAGIQPGAGCALGLVTACQNRRNDAAALLARVETALATALAGDDNAHICQLAPESLDEQDTLVHSNEKRFLFFGGE